MYLPVSENAIGGRVEAGRAGATTRAGKETGGHSGARRGGARGHTEGGSGKAKAEGRRPSGSIAKAHGHRTAAPRRRARAMEGAGNAEIRKR